MAEINKIGSYSELGVVNINTKMITNKITKFQLENRYGLIPEEMVEASKKEPCNWNGIWLYKDNVYEIDIVDRDDNIASLITEEYNKET